MKKLISIVVPAYNEEGNIPELARRLAGVFQGLPAYDYEAIIVENGSHDGTYQALLKVRETDSRIKIVQLSRNFKPDGGISAGLEHASGDAVIIMNADLQDPPEKIPEFLALWEKGFEIVYGVIRKRTEKSRLRRLFYALYYRLLNYLTGNLCPVNVSDFRLIDRVVCRAFLGLRERNRFVRGMILWTGFRQTGVIFDRHERHAGESKAVFWVSLQIGLNGIFSFSHVPLRLATFMGFTFCFLSFCFLIRILVEYLMFGVVVGGLYTTWALIVMLFGIQFFIIGILGEYMARIYDEVKARPNYIVRTTHGLGGTSPHSSITTSSHEK